MSIDIERSIPLGFWTLPSVQDALDRQDVGTLLDLIIKQGNSSQHILAEILDMRQPQISGYIRGLHSPKTDTVNKIADRLGFPFLVRQRLLPSLPDEIPQVQIPGILAMADRIGQTHDTSTLATWHETVEHGDPADAWTELAQAISAQPPARLQAVERLLIRTSGFFYLATKLPARHLRDALAYHVDNMRWLLDAATCQDTRTKLTAAIGEATYLAACCHADLGHPDGALTKLKVTKMAADQADDPAMAAVELDARSRFQAFFGNHQKALSLAAHGLRAAQAANSPGTLAYMHLRTAEEHMALGHIPQAIGAWKEAESRYAETDVDADRNWTRLLLAPDCFTSVKAVISSVSGRTEEATSIAENVAAALGDAHGQNDAVALINASLALATVGKLTTAAQVGRAALEAVRASGAVGCLHRAQIVANLIRDRGRLTSLSRAYIEDVDTTQRYLDTVYLAQAV